MTMRKSGTDEFIKKAKEVHGEKYDYAKVDLSKTKVNAVCPNHSSFWQSFKTFLGFNKKKNSWESWDNFLSVKG